MVKVIKRVERKRTYNLNCKYIVCPDCGVSIPVNE